MTKEKKRKEKIIKTAYSTKSIVTLYADNKTKPGQNTFRSSITALN